MSSRSSKRRLVSMGLVAALAGVLGGLSWEATAASNPHLISHKQAQASIARFRASAASGAARAHFFARSAFDALLAQPGTTGLRIYYGKYPDGREALVLYATDKDGQDLTGTVVNRNMDCPPFCPDSDSEAVAPPVTSHLVSQEYAQDLIARFRASAAPDAIRAQSLERSAVDALLAQPGAVGIRIYYSKYSDGGDTFVLCNRSPVGACLRGLPGSGRWAGRRSTVVAAT